MAEYIEREHAEWAQKGAETSVFNSKANGGKTVFRYIADGNLKAYKLSQRCVRIDETDLEKFVKGT